ncbi:MAG: YidC/Oxa1 family insertase periplasmic-domain containing protein [Planctomycetota bacterium]
MLVGVPPQPPPPAEVAQDGDADVGDAEIEAVDPADGDADVAGQPDAVEADGDGDSVDLAASQRSQSPSWTTLGSMDPKSSHWMLVTLNSRGSGIERIELTRRKPNESFYHRRVDVRSGYLGYLASEPSPSINGIVVNVVGPGTPADLAKSVDVAGGLKVGDVVTNVGGLAVTTPSELRDSLAKTKPGETVSIEVTRQTQSLVFQATLTEHPLDLVRLARTGGPDQIPGNLSRLSALITLAQVNRKSIPGGANSIPKIADPSQLIWELDEADNDQPDSARYTLDLRSNELEAAEGEAVRLQRSYTLKPNSFVLDMNIRLTNLGEGPQDLAYRLSGPNGVTMEGWWYSNKISPNWGGAAARDVVFKSPAGGYGFVSGYELLKLARKTPNDLYRSIFAPDGDEGTKQLSFIGIDAQYFNAAYLPPEGEPLLNDFRRAAANVVANPTAIPDDKDRAINSSFYLESNARTLAKGESIDHNLRIFAGPKQPELLEQYGLGETVYYGWFGPASKLLGWILHFLASIVSNYAVAIVLLTVLVRSLMFPLSRKAAVNAQRMQELAPELKKIAEQHKDDMEARMKAQRELQQRVGFNPMAGCLPMFAQLPIFIGLYRLLSVDIELRQAAFASWTTWASNLAGPDQFHFWGNWMIDWIAGRGNGWLGPYFNILPMAVVALFFLQQKLFMPPATDEQTEMTQKVMGFMTLFMGLFFFRVPAGLCIYFITSSLWGIAERILVKKTLPSTPHFDKAVLESASAVTSKTPSKNGDTSSKSLADRLREKMKPDEPAAVPPHKRKRPAAKGKKR